MVRTQDFQSCNRGSIPRGCTNFNAGVAQRQSRTLPMFRSRFQNSPPAPSFSPLLLPPAMTADLYPVAPDKRQVEGSNPSRGTISR